MISKEAASIILAWKLRWNRWELLDWLSWYYPEFRFDLNEYRTIEKELYVELLKLIESINPAGMVELHTLLDPLPWISPKAQKEILCWMQTNSLILLSHRRRPKSHMLKFPVRLTIDLDNSLSPQVISSIPVQENINSINLEPAGQMNPRLKALRLLMGTQ